MEGITRIDMNKTLLREIVERHVKEGFAEKVEIVEKAICELVDDTPREQLLRTLEQMTDRALAKHHREESRWAYLTDCDRLDRAFAKLEEAGIVARQHFSCCNNCGHKQIMLEVRRKQRTEHCIGYAFFHRGDTERAAKTGILYITFGDVVAGGGGGFGAGVDGVGGGSVAGDGMSGRCDSYGGDAVGRAIVAALEGEGLSVIWNGSYLQRICVNGLNWQRRRVAVLDVGEMAG